MSILGIDFGLKHIGLALSINAILAEPLGQIKYKNKKDLLNKIKSLLKEHNIEKIVIGVSERKMAKKTKEFGQELCLKIKMPVVYQDETLTSIEASKKMIEAGVSRKKRQIKSHQVAAAMILQDFLDENRNCC